MSVKFISRLMGTSCQDAKPAGDLRPIVSRLYNDEDGSLTILGVFLMVAILIMGGLGYDIMYQELQRTRIQNTIDRAVLAAASLKNDADPQQVVTDYFEKSGMADYLVSAQVSQATNRKTVEVNTAVTVNPLFTHLIGAEPMTIYSHAIAEEARKKVEISLVLDISGSMAGARMTNLKSAASEFIDTVLTEENRDLVSVSLIPYSEQVNAGSYVFNRINTRKLHDYSYCIAFDAADFTTTEIDPARRYRQDQHFQWNYYGNNDRTRTVCPRYQYEEILPISQDAVTLKWRINALQPRAGTAIYIGMKWAAAMVDPSMRAQLNPVEFTANGSVENIQVVPNDNPFKDRPADYDDPDTDKYIILMTDGMNSFSYRLSDYAYSDNSRIAHWNNYNLWYYLYNYVSSSQRSMFYRLDHNEAQANGWLNQMCTAAKNRGITVFTIGFEVPEAGNQPMRDCATSPNFYYPVSGIEIGAAFQSIASQITQLKLMQ